MEMFIRDYTSIGKMSYSKKIEDLSQNQAIENLKAIISSDYFKAYEFYCPSNNRIYSDMISVDSIGGIMKTFKVGDLADTVVALLDSIESKGILNEAFVELTPSEERLRNMEFEDRLYEDDLNLPLCFYISKNERYNGGEYSFSIFNLSFKESYFESRGLDLKDAKQKRGRWYSEITRNLKKILPNQF